MSKVNVHSAQHVVLSLNRVTRLNVWNGNHTESTLITMSAGNFFFKIYTENMIIAEIEIPMLSSSSPGGGHWAACGFIAGICSFRLSIRNRHRVIGTVTVNVNSYTCSVISNYIYMNYSTVAYYRWSSGYVINDDALSTELFIGGKFQSHHTLRRALFCWHIYRFS